MHKKNKILQIKNITKSFKRNKVLKGVFLDVVEGEILGLIGGSGAGKTTFFNTLIGFITPDNGEIFYQKKSLKTAMSANGTTFKKSVGFGSQIPSFYNKLTVLENLCFFGELYGLNKKKITKHAKHLLKLTFLTDAKDVLAENLSLGMKKRLDIACALIHKPKILILDEPTSDLDPVLKKQVLNLIKRINAFGVTILISSHSLNDLEVLCDRIAILIKGKITHIGTTKQLSQLFDKTKKINLETSPGKYSRFISVIKKIKGVVSVQESSQKLTISVKNPEVAVFSLFRLLNKFKEKIVNISVKSPSLDELFEELHEDVKK